MSTSSSDEQLDATSPMFDPSKALYSVSVKLPNVSAQPLDNISKFELSSTGEVTIKADKARKPNEYDVVPIERDLSRVAETSQTTTVQRKMRPRRTVTARMSEIGKSSGPLSRIAKLCYSRQRVKVYTRSAVSVRGHCEGFIIAFDKHWNLVMDNVDEVWTRKNKYKSLAIGNSMKLNPTDSKPYTVIKRTRGHQVCQRHIPRMMIRGEQIVLVAKSQNSHYYNQNRQMSY